MNRRDEIRARGICPHCAADDCWQPTPPGMRSGKGYCEATGLAVYSGPESDADADLVAHAPADLRDLLAVAEAARLVSAALAEFGSYYVVDGRSVRHELDDALARLDAVTGGER